MGACARRQLTLALFAMRAKKKWLIIAVAVFILGALTFGAPLVSGRLQIGDRQKIESELREVLGAVNLSGDVVYEELKDNGCNTDHSVGLQKWLECNFSAYKIAVSDDELTIGLATLDSKLREIGFERLTPQGQTAEDFEEKLSGNGSGGLNYYRTSGSELTASISYYRNDKDRNDFQVKQLIQSNKLSEPSNKQFLYGIVLSAGYYRCEPLLFEPCFLQPSSSIKP